VSHYQPRVYSVCNGDMFTAGGMKRHSTMAADILVKETPVKKQVENYQRFKLQRLR